MAKVIAYKGATLTCPDPEDATKTEEYIDAHFSGSVTFSNPLSLDQEAAFEEAGAAAREVMNRAGNLAPSAIMRAALPGILSCVEKWDLTNVPAEVSMDSWPLRPRVQVADLFSWLMTEITKLYTDSTEPTAPNA
jgi:hypothetical protein